MRGQNGVAQEATGRSALSQEARTIQLELDAAQGAEARGQGRDGQGSPENTWAAAGGAGAGVELRPGAARGMLLGRPRRPRLIGWSDDRHLFIGGRHARRQGRIADHPQSAGLHRLRAGDRPQGGTRPHCGDGGRGELGKLVVLDPFGENGRFPSGALQSARRTRPPAARR